MFTVDALTHSEPQIILLTSTKRLPYGKGRGDFIIAKIALLSQKFCFFRLLPQETYLHVYCMYVLILKLKAFACSYETNKSKTVSMV